MLKVENTDSEAQLHADHALESQAAFPSPCIRALDWSLAVVAVGTSTQLLLTWLASLHPAVELAAHFSMHCLFLTLVAIPLAFLRRRTGIAIVLAVILCGEAYTTRVWQLWPRKVEPSIAYQQTLRVMSWNLLFDNPDLDSAIQLIEETDPDVLILIEVEQHTIGQLQGIQERFPHRHVIPGFGGAGMAVFSRIPGTNFSLQPFALAALPAIIARIPGGTDNNDLSLVALHTLSPVPPSRALIRDAQLKAFLEWSRELSGPICLCGDLNITPWAPAFHLLEQSEFLDSRLGSGNWPSWPSALGRFGIPIDHALCRGACQISNRQVVYESHGSDHFPILFDISY